MKLFFRCVTFVCILTIVAILFISSVKKLSKKDFVLQRPSSRSPSIEAPLVIAVCSSPGMNDSVLGLLPTEDDTDQTYSSRLLTSWARQEKQITTMLKSLLYFSKAPVWRIVVLTDTLDTFNKVSNLTAVFPRRQRQRLYLEHHEQWYPQGYPGITTNWRPCAWAKQFMAEALPRESAAVYVDTDLVFLGPAEELWQILESMKTPQMIALAPEPQYLEETEPRVYAGRVGLNTGVMVANLTRLRQLPGGGLGSAVLKEGVLTPRPRHDQDAVNHFLEPKSHLLKEISARWNFIPSSCRPSAPPCPDCKTRGILILHGADMTFFRYVDTKFKAIFANLALLNLDEEPRTFQRKLEAQLTLLDSGQPIFLCSNYSDFTEALTHGLSKL